MAVHDLRAPMVRLRIAAEFLSQEVAARPSEASRLAAELLQALQDDGERIDALLTRLLAAARTATRERGKRTEQPHH